MAKATSKEFCKDCKNSIKGYGRLECKATQDEDWTDETDGRIYEDWRYGCDTARGMSSCDFQVKPTVWERIKAVLL